jgi:hypothetical protein
LFSCVFAARPFRYWIYRRRAVIGPLQTGALMELILIIVVLVLLFGGGGYYGRRRGHW